MSDATEDVHAVFSDRTSLDTFFGDRTVQSLTRTAAESTLGLGFEISKGWHNGYLDIETSRNQVISTVAVIFQDLERLIVVIGMKRRPDSAFWNEVR